MSPEENPYIAHCSFCGDGLLRFTRCSECDEIVAICDECELMWEDVEQVSEDANCSSDSTFPRCPACGATDSTWATPTLDEIEESGLDQFMMGESV